MKNKKKIKFLNKGRALGLRHAALLIDPQTSYLSRWEVTDKLLKMANDIEKNIHVDMFQEHDAASVLQSIVIEAAISECIGLLTSNDIYAVKSKIDVNTIIGGPDRQTTKLSLESGSTFHVYEYSFAIEVVKDLLGIKFGVSVPGIGVLETEFHRSSFEAVQRICELYRHKGLLK